MNSGRQSHSAAPRNPASRDQVLRLAAVLGLAILPALVAPDAVGKAAALVPAIVPGAEYLAGGRPGLVFGIVPLVALSATLLFLAPGLFLAMRLGRSRSLVEWVFFGFTCSLVIVSVVSGLVQAFVGDALGGRTYAVLVAAVAVVGLVAVLRTPTRQAVAWPLARAADRRDAVSLLAFWAVVAIGVMPKLLWESFNGDGAHAFESSRLLLRQALPFWPADAGPVAGFPGVTSMLYAFPSAWFLRLMGEGEFAARIPFLMYVPVLACGIRTLGDVQGTRDADDMWPAAGLLTSLLAFLLAMAYSASYNPYSADIALPATQDTLLMIMFLGVLVASWRGEWGWLALFVALTYVSLPSGLILIAFWMAARALVERPVPWRSLLGLGALLVSAMFVAAVVPRLLRASGAAPPGGEYGLVGILKYFAFLQFTDFTRLLYVAIPAGLFPLAAVLAWRSQDRLSRALTLVTVAYFAFFFVQAHVSLHHFVPAMVLPMVVAWRVVTQARPDRGLWHGRVWVLAGALASFLAFPWGRSAIHGDGREVGQAATVRILGYERSAPDVLRASTLFDRIFAYDWDPAVPGVYGGSPLVWNHYAQHGGDPGAGTNYILQLTSDPPPPGWRLAGFDSAGASLYVRSDSVLARDRARRPVTPPGSRWLAVPRGILFHSVPLSGGPRIIDVAAVLESLGVDIDPLLQRLGARRRS